jgi:hypothetical protein
MFFLILTTLLTFGQYIYHLVLVSTAYTTYVCFGRGIAPLLKKRRNNVPLNLYIFLGMCRFTWLANNKKNYVIQNISNKNKIEI